MKLAHIVPPATLAILLACGQGSDAPTEPPWLLMAVLLLFLRTRTGDVRSHRN